VKAQFPCVTARHNLVPSARDGDSTVADDHDAVGEVLGEVEIVGAEDDQCPFVFDLL
jgi:hypothetical protein